MKFENENVSPDVLARRQYQREWRKQHPEKVRIYAKTYWGKVAKREMTKNDERNETFGQD